MANKRLNAVVNIGGAVSKKLTTGISITSQKLGQLGDSIRDVKKRQAELTKQRRDLIKQGKSVDALDREYEQLSRTLEDLTAKQKRWLRVAEKAKGVGSAFRNLRSEMGSLARTTGIAVGAAAGGVFALANSTAELGDNVAKTADKLGMGIQELQEYRYAAERSGIASNTFDMATQRMIRRLAEAAQGTGEAQGALRELGLDARALGEMTPDQQMAVLADALQGVESQSDRVRLAFKLFDSEGVAMVNMLKDGSKGLNQLRADARATGYVLDEEAARSAEKFKDRMLDAKLAMAGVKNTIGSALMPSITDLMTTFSGYVKDNRKQVQEFAKTVGEGMKNAVPTIIELAKGFATVASLTGSLIGTVATLVGGFDNLGMIIGAAFAAKTVIAIGTFATSLWSLLAATTAVGGGLAVVTGGIKAMTVALMTNPIGLIIAGIATAAYLIYKNWEPISGFFSDLWQGVKNVFAKGWEFIKTVFSWSPIGLAVRSWGGVFDWFGDKWEGVKVFAGKAWDFVKTIFEWSPLGLAIKAWGKLFDWLGEKFDWVGKSVSAIKDFFGFGDDEEEAPAKRETETTERRRIVTVQEVEEVRRQRREEMERAVRPGRAQNYARAAGAGAVMLAGVAAAEPPQQPEPEPVVVGQLVEQEQRKPKPEPTRTVQRESYSATVGYGKPGSVKRAESERAARGEEPPKVQRTLGSVLYQQETEQAQPRDGVGSVLYKQRTEAAESFDAEARVNYRQRTEQARPRAAVGSVLYQQTTEKAEAAPAVGEIVYKQRTEAADAKMQEQRQRFAKLPEQARKIPSRAPTVNQQNSYSFSITQQPGEDSEALAARVAELVEERRDRDQTAALYDNAQDF